MIPPKKILIIIDWFLPGYKAGGPIQSCVNFCIALQQDFEIFVLTTDTDHGEAKPYQEITADTWLCNKRLGVNIYYAKKKHLTLKQLSDQIQFVNADFIYLNHLFSPRFVIYPLWLKYFGKIKGKVIACPRGALYDSALSLKSYKKIPLLKLYKWSGISKKIRFQATNKREEAAIKKYFPGCEIVVADNLPNMHQPPFESCPKEEGKLKCIFIARVVPIKNLLFLLHALYKINEEVTLTIIGPLEDKLYWQVCEKEIQEMPANIMVHYSGAKPNHELANLIQQNHLFVLPTTGENFGHSIFEALICGRPVLISDQTPWQNLKAQNAGWDLPLNNEEGFVKAIKEMSLLNQIDFDAFAKGAWQYAHNHISNSKAKEQYFNLFK